MLRCLLISIAKTPPRASRRSTTDDHFDNSVRTFIMVQFNADVVAATAAALNFTQVALTPPLNWIAGSSLFPSQIIAGYNAELAEYTAEEWSAYLLDTCKTFSACTSVDGFQGVSSDNCHASLLATPPSGAADRQY